MANQKAPEWLKNIHTHAEIASEQDPGQIVYREDELIKALDRQGLLAYPVAPEGTPCAMFVGRWQNWHEGHRWLIDQALNKGHRVLICIRDIKTRDEKNPKTAEEVVAMLYNELKQLMKAGWVDTLIIPDIVSFNYGRDVGYEVIHHEPPAGIAAISGTKIREELKNKNEQE